MNLFFKKMACNKSTENKQKILFVFTFLIVFFSLSLGAFAAPRTSPFIATSPVLDPNNPADPNYVVNGSQTCLPTDANCYPGLGDVTVTPVGTLSGDTGDLRFSELSANGLNYVGFQAPDSITSNVVWTLPSGDGTSGQVLTTDGSGVLSWTNPTSSTFTNGGNSFGAATTLGTNDNFALNFETNGVTSFTLSTAGNGSFSNDLTVAGNTFLNGNTTLGNATTDRLTVTSQILGGSPLVFQGATDDLFTTTFAITDPTANNTITFPDASGTVMLSGGLGLFGSGSAGSPSVSFSSDSDTGIYNPSANTIGFTAGGTSVGSWDSTGLTIAAGLTTGGTNTLGGTTNITGATTFTSSPTISALTASRAVFTNGSSQLATSGTSANLSASLTDETGTGVAVFGTSPNITTSLTTGSGTFALLNTNATTVNAFGAATAINIGAAGSTITGGGALTINSGAGTTLTLDGGTTGALDLGTSANQKTITIGNATGATALSLNSGTGLQSFTSLATTGNAFNFTGNSLTSGDGISLSTSSAGASGNLFTISSSNAGATARAINIDLDNGDVVNDAIVLTTDETTTNGSAADSRKFSVDTAGQVRALRGFSAGTASTNYFDNLIQDSNDAQLVIQSNKSSGSAIKLQSVAGGSTSPVVTLQNTIGDIDTFVTNTTPESGIVGSVGDIAHDETSGLLYIKVTGNGTNTGWQSVNTSAGPCGVGSAFTCNGGNTQGGALTLGTNDAFGLNLETNNVTALALDISGNANVTGDLTVTGGDIFGPSGAAFSITSDATQTLNLDSGTTGNVVLGGGNSAKTISIGNGTAANLINIGTDNTNAFTDDTINIGSINDATTILGTALNIGTSGTPTVTVGSAAGGTLDIKNGIVNSGALNGGSVYVNDTFGTSGDTTLGANLSVGGDSVFAGNVTIGNLLTGSLSIPGKILNYSGNSFLTMDGTTVGDGNELIFNAVDPTTDRTVTFDDASGTVLLDTTLAANLNASGAFINGGNIFPGTATLGTNDAFPLKLRTAGTDYLTLSTAGNLAWNSTTPTIAINNTGTFSISDGTNSLFEIADNGTSASVNLNNQGEIRFSDADSSNYVGFKSPAVVGANTIWRLPSADGIFNQVLTTDGTGGLSWSNAGVCITCVTFDGNTNGAALTVGTNDAFGLNLETNNTTRFTVASGTSTLTGSGATVLAGGSTLDITSAAGSALSITSGTTGALTLDSGTSGIVNLGTGNTGKTLNIGTGTGGDVKNGISGNWLWWNFLAGGMLTTFFFANLWRRSGVLI
jgi:hypothetical protein